MKTDDEVVHAEDSAVWHEQMSAHLAAASDWHRDDAANLRHSVAVAHDLIVQKKATKRAPTVRHTRKMKDESEPEEVTVPKRNLTEVSRLALVVNAIENDCHTCPQGAYKMTP